MPEIARMAASLVACLARPNGAPHSLPYGRFRAFACAFHMETVPKARSDEMVAGGAAPCVARQAVATVAQFARPRPFETRTPRASGAICRS
ncbi:hypothetical protein F3J12_17680 [Burkholderia sp. Ax-1735]|nr:hypothetical protein [Burkholderia sp. Ap-955]NIF11325.1 hypothetical protein [Burkholderia sp. Ax-1735]NIG03691.1 hypothetical protein [Burkholderia sp. Tr-849]